MRLLLIKQDKLVQLEKQLERIDRDETSPLFVGSIRYDRSVEREHVLSEIDMALADYGTWRILQNLCMSHAF